MIFSSKLNLKIPIGKYTSSIKKNRNPNLKLKNLINNNMIKLVSKSLLTVFGLVYDDD